MSNKTEGKKALEAGDFTLAEEKLIKALEFHPDDSELWWAMMLCKSELRSDAELRASVTAEFKRAAEAGEGIPKPPFDTPYCKNALRYETDGRKRKFIQKLYDELNELWFSVRGKNPSLRAPREKKLPDIGKILIGFEYGAIALIAVGVWLVCYALLVYKVWALWTGFAVLVVFALAAFILVRVMGKFGVKTDNASVALFTVIVLSALSLLTVGILRKYQMVIIMASVVLAIAAAIGIYRLFARKKTAPNKSDTRDPNELARRARGETKQKHSGGKPAEKGEGNEYQDEFD
ncbi:MAG: hypothetical protein J1F39_01415 [Clostridiales bacterium]|nr:hypothetical protein [Clostridiales bacterium]